SPTRSTRAGRRGAGGELSTLWRHRRAPQLRWMYVAVHHAGLVSDHAEGQAPHTRHWVCEREARRSVPEPTGGVAVSRPHRTPEVKGVYGRVKRAFTPHREGEIHRGTPGGLDGRAPARRRASGALRRDA